MSRLPRCLQFSCPKCKAPAGKRCKSKSSFSNFNLCLERRNLVLSVSPTDSARYNFRDTKLVKPSKVVYPKCLNVKERKLWLETSKLFALQ